MLLFEVSVGSAANFGWTCLELFALEAIAVCNLARKLFGGSAGANRVAFESRP